MNRTNLMPAYRLETQWRRSRLRGWTVCCALCGLVLLSAYGISYAFWGGGSSDQSGRQKPDPAKVEHVRQAVKQVQRELAQVQVELQAHQAVGNQPDWSILLASVSALLGDDVFLKRCQLAPAEEPSAVRGAADQPRTTAQRQYVLWIAGYGQTQEAVTQFVLRLEESFGKGLFDRVRMVRTAREPLYDGTAVAFQLECSMGKGPSGTK